MNQEQEPHDKFELDLYQHGWMESSDKIEYFKYFQEDKTDIVLLNKIRAKKWI